MPVSTLKEDVLQQKVERYKSFLEWFCYDHGYVLDDIQYLVRELESGYVPTVVLSSFMSKKKLDIRKFSNNSA
jgi:hypothetical protein